MGICHGPARCGRIALVCLLMLVGSGTFAATPRLVRDINPNAEPISSAPRDFIDLGAVSHFNAIDGVNGYEPWTTNGTAEGTFVWGDVTPGIAGAYQRNPVRAGALTYLVQHPGFDAPYLWISNGTPQGTRRLDISAWQTNVDNVDTMGALGDLLLLGAFNTTNSARELWICDGTDAGTRRVPSADGERYSVSAYVIADSRVFFINIDQAGVVEPWVSDGTSQGTYRLAEIPGGAAGSTYELVRVGDYILFTAATTTSGHELWRIDMRDMSVTQVEDIAAGSASGIADNSRMGRVGDVVVFAASPTGDSEMNLWRSDGTAAGTFEISDVGVSSGISSMYFGTGRYVLIHVPVSSTELQLWATDGTASGTQLIQASATYPLFQVANRFYFPAAGGANQLMTSDGTTAGTRMLSGIIPANEQLLDIAGTDSVIFVRTIGQRLPPPNNDRIGPGHLYRHDLSSATTTTLTRYDMDNPGSTPYILGYAQGRLYFDNMRSDTGRELWTSDGTVDGTRMLKNLSPETRTFDSSPADFVRLQDTLFFTADDGTHGREVWYSDGTNAGTQMLLDVVPGDAGSEPSDLFVVANQLYFFARDAAGAYRLWRSDGSGAGTQSLAAVQPRPSTLRSAGCDSRGVALADGNILFAGYDDTFGLRLWRTNGTTAGTVRLTHLSPGVFGGAKLCHLTRAGDRVYFQAADTSGRELWKSDGTVAGTQLVADLNSQLNGSEPFSLTQWNGSLYFIANNEQGAQLWTTDGSSSSTRIAATFENGVPTAIAGVVANRLLVSVRTQRGDGQVVLPWVVANGTTSLLASAALNRMDGVPFITNGLAFFSGVTNLVSGTDLEPWVTDGTPAGTLQLLDTNPGYSYPTSFTDFHGVTLFETETYRVGRLLWRTNGTAAGTRSIGEFTLGAQRLAAGQRMFYVANDAAAGIELFAIDNERPTAGDDMLGSVQAGQSVGADVVANDADSDGEIDVDSVAIVAAPAGGSVNIGANGQITYVARVGFSGADSFTYSVADDQGYASGVATVRVTVTAAPTPPADPPASGGGGGGGGSMALLYLCLLTLLAAAARVSCYARIAALSTLNIRSSSH